MTPDGWRVGTIGQLFELQLGKMLNKEATRKTPNFPYLGNQEVQWGRFDFSDLRRMHFSVEEQTKFSLRHGDLLVCEGGEVGRTALWREEFDCYFQKALHRLRPVDGQILSEFMLHFMRFAADAGRLADFTSQSSIAHLTREKLAQVKVPLPPLPEQRKIAAILSSVDEAIEGTQAVIDQLQVVKKAMMADLLTRGIPGRHKSFKQTEIGEIPADWEVASFSSFVDDMRGGSPLTPSDFVEEGFAVLHKGDILPDGVVDLSPDSSRYASIAFAEGHPRSIIDAGFLVVTLRDLVPSGPSIGLISRLPQDREMRLLLAQGAYGLKLDADKMDPDYLIAVANSSFYRRAARKLAVGSTQIHIRNGDFLAMEIPIPPPEERRVIGSAMTSLSALASAEQKNIEGLRLLKMGLMNELLTGTRRVRVE